MYPSYCLRDRAATQFAWSAAGEERGNGETHALEIGDLDRRVRVDLLVTRRLARGVAVEELEEDVFAQDLGAAWFASASNTCSSREGRSVGQSVSRAVSRASVGQPASQQSGHQSVGLDEARSTHKR